MSYSFFIAHLLRLSAKKSDEDKIFRKFCRTQKSSAKKFRVKFFVELFLLMKLIRCSFSRWFRITRFRRIKMSRKKVISRARLSSTLRKFSKKYVSFRPPFWLGPTFFLHSPQLCPNRVCPASNSIPSDFGAKRKFLPNLENFRLSRPGTLRKIFFVKNFFSPIASAMS